MAAPERIDQPSAPPSQNQLETGWHEQLQMLLNEPVPIQEYVIANTNEIHDGRSLRSDTTVTKNEIFLASFVEVLTEVLARGDVNIQREAYHLLTSVLVTNGVLPGRLVSDELRPIRRPYTDSLQCLLTYVMRQLRTPHPLTGAHTLLRNPQSMIGNTSQYMLQSLFASPSYRYARDFISIGALGAGGFGHVVAARNLLDGQKYAVKHVRFDYYNSTTCLEVLREVRTLSQLYHPHIVRYHTAWVEMELLTAPTGRTCDDEAAGYSGVDGAHMLDLSVESNTSLRRVHSSPCITFAHSSNGDKEASTRDDMPVAVRRRSDDKHDEHSARPDDLPNLCAKTLRQLINERNETIVCEQMDDRKWRSACAQHTSVVFAVVSSTANERVVQQLLSALAHIHSMNIIHRDVTPNNVFVRDPRATIAVGGALANLHVLLGDFGLACEHQPAAGISDDVPDASTSEQHHAHGVGTLTYSAPEQLSTRGSHSPAADVYSLGVVAYELYRPFRTHMEKIACIMQARQDQHVDTHTRTRFPAEVRAARRAHTCMYVQTALIDQCLCAKYRQRPTARALLDTWATADMTASIAELQSRVHEQEAEIERLRAALANTLDNNNEQRHWL